jgi:hypothetical protein
LGNAADGATIASGTSMASGLAGSSVGSEESLLQDVNRTEAKYNVVKILNSFMV